MCSSVFGDLAVMADSTHVSGGAVGEAPRRAALADPEGGNRLLLIRGQPPPVSRCTFWVGSDRWLGEGIGSKRAALVVVMVAFLLGSEVPGRSDAAETTPRRAPAIGPERPLTGFRFPPELERTSETEPSRSTARTTSSPGATRDGRRHLRVSGVEVQHRPRPPQHPDRDRGRLRPGRAPPWPSTYEFLVTWTRPPAASVGVRSAVRKRLDAEPMSVSMAARRRLPHWSSTAPGPSWPGRTDRA